MNARSVIGALASGLGLVAGVVACAVVAAVAAVALGVAPEGRADDAPQAIVPTPRPVELVVALSLGELGLQTGAVRGREVVIARGFEVDLARLIQRRLRIPRIRFVDVRPSSRLLATGNRVWHLAIASVSSSARTGAAADLSTPYLPAGQAVVPRRGLGGVRRIVDLRSRLLCATRGSAGVETITTLVRPIQPPLVAPGNERLLQLVQTGACDAALVDAVAVGRLVTGRGKLIGPISVRIDRDDGLVVAVSRGGPFGVAEIDRAIGQLRAAGALRQVARRWLTIDPARLRQLR